MKMLRQILGPILALLLTFGSVAEVSAPVTVAAAGVVLGVGHAQAATPAQRAVVLNGVPSWVLRANGALPSIDMDFAHNRAWVGGSGPRAPPSLLTTTRASTGYAQWADGHLSSFAANVPRITDLGLLVEQAATNLALQSGAFSNAAWNVSSARPTIVTTNETAPDGTATAVRATVSSVNNRFAQGVTVTNNQPVTFTVWVKAAPSSSAVNVRLASNNGGAWNTGGDAVVALTSSWQRLTMEYQNSFGTGITLFVGAVKSDSTNDATCYGDVLIWGGQFEANSTFPTSYIPTTTVAVTRAADSIQPIGVALTAFQSVTGWARVATPYGVNNAGTSYLLVREQTNANDAIIISASSTTTRSLVGGSGVATATIGGGGTWASSVRAASTWDASGIANVANGGTVATGVTPFSAGPSNDPYIGSRNGSTASTFISSYISRITFGSTKLSNTSLQALAQ